MSCENMSQAPSDIQAKEIEARASKVEKAEE